MKFITAKLMDGDIEVKPIKISGGFYEGVIEFHSLSIEEQNQVYRLYSQGVLKEFVEPIKPVVSKNKE